MTGPLNDQPVAIVIPWFGRELRGGAELQAWNLATRLSAQGYRVEVLTTCCASFHHDWSVNSHPAGVTNEAAGFAVRRFPVETRDRAAFDRVCAYLLGLDRSKLKSGVSPISEEDERIFCEHLIRCPALLSYLRTDGWRYAAFIFLPYLYGPTLDGIHLVASRAFLQPCLHDEAYARLRCVQRAVYAAKRLLWLSAGEYELGRQLFGPAIQTNSIVGMAGFEPAPPLVEIPADASLDHLKPFVLLLGRKDEGKGTLHAVEAFRRHRATKGSNFNMVVAGPGDLSFQSPTEGMYDLGMVSEAQRYWLLHNTRVLLQPSPNESFSRVLFEAWQCEKPVIVRRSCLATAFAVDSCRGGWVAETPEEWSEVLAQVESLPAEKLITIGQHGAAYAAQVADWNHVMDRYEDALRPFTRASRAAIRANVELHVLKPQRIRLIAGCREVCAWDLAPGRPFESGWINIPDCGPERTLEFETDTPGQTQPPDPRTLGFCLTHIDLEAVDSPDARMVFTRGWNRSQAGPGTIGSRWSTGSAQILILRENGHGHRGSVHQVLPNLSYGDAIGNHTLWIRNRLQALGFVSEIFARHITPSLLDQAYPFDRPDVLPPDAAIIYHHSIGTEITPWVCKHPGPKALLYHNITPAQYFEPYRPEFAAICRHGREELPGLASHFPISVGDSRFNADELTACGFQSPGVLPLCIDPAHWAYLPDEGVMMDLQDGRTNILFVGRIVPNKRHEDLIYTFKFWLQDDPEARLIFVGTAEVSSFYLECLQELARRLRVDHAVHFVGQVNSAQLHAYYRCASMFWCFSQHEGFCVPLIEACAFGIPVFALAKGAVPETLGDAGFLLDNVDNPAETARRIASNRTIFELRKMATRVTRYGTSQVAQDLQTLVSRLFASTVDANSINNGPHSHQLVSA